MCEHVQNNAVLLFFPSTNQTPRMRLLRTCDTVQKLFAHALVGNLSDEKRQRSKILSIRLTGRSEELKIVEEDEDDYDGFYGSSKATAVLGGHKS